MRTFFFVLLVICSFSLNLLADEVTCDVLVVGGGAAGVPAAIQAGRLGMRTILVEASSVIGGNMTVGGVNSPISFIKDGTQSIAGIGWEWCEKTAQMSDGILPDSKMHYRIDPATLICVGEELLQEAGVEIRYFEAPVKVRRAETEAEKAAWNWEVQTCAQGEMRTIHVFQLIDCTGNGTLAAMCGAERMREQETMPGSFNYVIQHSVDRSKLSREELTRRYDEAIKDGRLKPNDSLLGAESMLNSWSSTYVYGADNSSAELRTKTNLEARASAMRRLRFIRSLPGGETARFVSMFPEAGVRETWRVRGKIVMNSTDYLAGKVWDDSICFALYQIDLHKKEWKDLVGIPLQKETRATVPLRALIPENVPNLLVAGRCISSDRETLAAVRIEPVCMATGQAAGTAASLAVRGKTTPEKVSMEELKKVLRENGAIVP